MSYSLQCQDHSQLRPRLLSSGSGSGRKHPTESSCCTCLALHQAHLFQPFSKNNCTSPFWLRLLGIPYLGPSWKTLARGCKEPPSKIVRIVFNISGPQKSDVLCNEALGALGIDDKILSLSCCNTKLPFWICKPLLGCRVQGAMLLVISSIAATASQSPNKLSLVFLDV